MPGSSATTHDHVQRMLGEIHQNYSKRLTLGMLAQTLEHQSAYLGRLFREAVGVTVHEYITRARMMFGAAQVRSGVKVEAVALDLGYRSKKNFYRQFKRRFGMTPEAYRQRDDAGPGGDRTRDDHAPRHAIRISSEPSASLAETSIAATGTPGARRRSARPASLTHKIVRALLSHRVAMLATDENGCCIAANEAALSITGYSVAELRRMPAVALFDSDIRSDARSRIQILLPVSPPFVDPSSSPLEIKKGHRMPNLHNVPETEWRSFFDRMSKALLGKWATIEVAQLDLGDQIVAEWIPLLGITYDSRDDLLDVALDRFDHLIYRPREIIVEEAPNGLASVAVVDAEGAKQVVRFREPLMLPPATESVGKQAK